MNMRILVNTSLLLSLVLLLSGGICKAQTGKLILSLNGFENNEGKAVIKLYSSSDGFPKDDEKAYKMLISKINQKECYVEIPNIQPGEYAVAVYHDENNNNILDTNFINLPKEGVGISNYPKMSKPDFKKASITIEPNKVKNQTIIINNLL